MHETTIRLTPSETDERRNIQLMHQILVSIGAKDFEYDPENKCFIVPNKNERTIAETLYRRAEMVLRWKDLNNLVEVLEGNGWLPDRPKEYAIVPARHYRLPYKKAI